MAAISQREEVRDALLNAVDALYRRYGYKKTTVEDIAQEARVCRATVYLYFKNKEEIALAWAERFNRRLRADLEKIARRADPPTEKLREILFTRVLIRFDFAQPYTQSIDELLAALRLPLLAQRERDYEAEAALLAKVLQEGENGGEFACTHPLETARLLIWATNSLLPHSLSARQLGERPVIEAKTRDLIQLLLDGLKRR